MNQQLLEWLASVNQDPYAFVMGAFPWAEPNSRLKEFPNGPEPWQKEILDLIKNGLVISTVPSN